MVGLTATTNLTIGIAHQACCTEAGYSFTCTIFAGGNPLNQVAEALL
jgi:hypothetical protein